MIAAAISLLRGSGLTGAGINQVIAASGAPKGSMYHHFPGGKLELARTALEAWGESVEQRLRAALAGPGGAAQNIRAVFEASAKSLAQAAYTRSCAIGTVTLDLTEETAPLAPVCARILASWHAAVADSLTTIPEPKRGALARFVVTSLQGAQIQARAARDHRFLLEAGELTAGLITQALSEYPHASTDPSKKIQPRGPRKSH